MKHPHAELMLEYAKDAMETDKPWELWEISDPRFTRESWEVLPWNPGWAPALNYRRKPEPEEVLPAVGTPVWVRNDTEAGWDIAMFVDKVPESVFKYRVAYNEPDEGETDRFKYMTTENPYRPAV